MVSKVIKKTTLSFSWWGRWWIKTRSSFFSKTKSLIQIISTYRHLKAKDITKSLSIFYDTATEKWVWTRTRDRPEFQWIGENIQRITKTNNRTKHNKKLIIIELGCGDGRFAEYLEETVDYPFLYTGIDCSSELIQVAKKRSIWSHVSFIVWDMSTYLSFLEQQSVDIVVGIASAQHLHYRQRKLLRHQIHRVLNYWWAYIISNRSYSQRMRTKHRPSIIAWWILAVINHKTFWRGDTMIPFKQSKSFTMQWPWSKESNNSTWLWFQELNPKQSIKNSYTTSMIQLYYRFYHIYTHYELTKLTHHSGLIVWQLWYMSDKGIYTDHRWSSRNTLLMATKELQTK